MDPQRSLRGHPRSEGTQMGPKEPSRNPMDPQRDLARETGSMMFYSGSDVLSGYKKPKARESSPAAWGVFRIPSGSLVGWLVGWLARGLLGHFLFRGVVPAG